MPRTVSVCGEVFLRPAFANQHRTNNRGETRERGTEKARRPSLPGARLEKAGRRGGVVVSARFSLPAMRLDARFSAEKLPKQGHHRGGQRAPAGGCLLLFKPLPWRPNAVGVFHPNRVSRFWQGAARAARRALPQVSIASSAWRETRSPRNTQGHSDGEHNIRCRPKRPQRR